jgi:hypothetical protein
MGSPVGHSIRKLSVWRIECLVVATTKTLQLAPWIIIDEASIAHCWGRVKSHLQRERMYLGASLARADASQRIGQRINGFCG